MEWAREELAFLLGVQGHRHVLAQFLLIVRPFHGSPFGRGGFSVRSLLFGEGELPFLFTRRFFFLFVL